MFKVEVTAKVCATKKELEQLICDFESARGNNVVENSFKWKSGERLCDPYDERSGYEQYFDGVDYEVTIGK